jgi:hypothetical protein
MEAYSAPVGYVFSLNAGGRSGVFDVVAGDFSAELAADSYNGIFAPVEGDATGSTKVARRRYKGAVYLEWFGVSSEDLDIFTGLSSATSLVSFMGGGEITCQPNSVFKLDTNYEPAISNITFDFKWSTLYGNGRIRFTGAGVDDKLDNIHVKNLRIGRSFSDATLIPRFSYCKNSSIRNVIKVSNFTTAMNFDFCEDSEIVNVKQIGGSSGAIGVLLLFCKNCLADRCVVEGGDLAYGFQDKGGRDNVFRNCGLKNVDSLKYGFYNRGDDPYSTSPTSGYDYPFPDLSWGVPDVRRETRRTKHENCYSIDCTTDFANFHAQEGIDAKFIGCKSINSTGQGFAGQKTVSGKERGYEFIYCFATGTTGQGFRFGSLSGDNITGTKCTGCVAENAKLSGFSFVNSDTLSENNRATDTALDGGFSFDAAFMFTGTADVVSTGDVVRDTGVTTNQSFGFSSEKASSCYLLGSYVDSTAVRPFDLAGEFVAENTKTPAVVRQNVNDSYDNAAMPFRVLDGDTRYVEYRLRGIVEATGEVAIFHKYAIVSGTTGDVVVIESEGDITPPINPQSITAPRITIVSATGRLTLGGLTGKTVEWKGGFSIKLI